MSERHGGGDPRAGAGQSTPGFPVEEHEQHQRRDEHRDEIFGPQRAAERRSEQGPIADPAAPEPGMEGETSERPERQLDYVVIELGGGEIEVVHAVDDQDRDQRPERANERARGLPHEDEGDDDDRLGEGVIGGIDAKHPVDDLDQSTTAAAAACHSRAAIRGRRSAPRSDRAAGSGKGSPAARSRRRHGGRGRRRRPPAAGVRPRRSIGTWSKPHGSGALPFEP